MNESEAIEIIQGGEAIFFIRILQDGEPVDQTGKDEFAVCIPLDAGGVSKINQTASTAGSVMERVGDAILAKYKITVKGPDSTLFKAPLTRSDLDIEIGVSTNANAIQRFKKKRILTIEKSNCDLVP